MLILKHKTFQKDYDKLSEKLKDKVDIVLIKFITSPFDITLNNHSLKGIYSGLRSINVNGDYRIIFREKSENKYEIIELIRIGTYSELYK